MKTKGANNKVDNHEAVVLVTADLNEMQSPNVQFSNELRDDKMNTDFSNRFQRKMTFGKMQKRVEFITSGKMKIVIAFLGILFVNVLLFCYVKNSLSEMNEVRQAVEEKQMDIYEMEKLQDTNISQIQSERITDLERIKNLEDKVEKQKMEIDHLETVQHTQFGHINDTNLSQKEELKNLSDRLDAKRAKLENIASTLRKHNETFQNLSNSVILDEHIDETRSSAAQISFTGVLVWKIKNFTEMLHNAKGGGTDMYYSDPFYTSPYGYKMCLMFFPNGNGEGEDTHISIFFSLMKSEMDDALTWPFSYKIKVMILDQSPGSRHFTKAIYPNPFNEVYKKPSLITPRIGNGWREFISHNELESKKNIYLKNDAIYIKAIANGSM